MAISSSSGGHLPAPQVPDANAPAPDRQSASASHAPENPDPGGFGAGPADKGNVPLALYANRAPTVERMQRRQPNSNVLQHDQADPPGRGQSALERLPNELIQHIHDFGPKQGPYLTAMMLTSRTLRVVTAAQTIATVEGARPLEEGLKLTLRTRAEAVTDMAEFEAILVSAKEGLISRDRVEVLEVLSKNLDSLAPSAMHSRPDPEDLKKLEEAVESVRAALKELKGSGVGQNAATLQTIVELVSQLSRLWGHRTVMDGDRAQLDVLAEMLADFRNIANDDKTLRADVVMQMSLLARPLGEIQEKAANGGERLDRFLDDHGEALRLRLHECKGEEDAKRAAKIWSSWKSLRSGPAVSGDVANDLYEVLSYGGHGPKSLYSSSVVTRMEHIDNIYRHLGQLDDKGVAQDVAGTMDETMVLLREELQAYTAVSEHVGAFFKDMRTDQERLTFIRAMEQSVSQHRDFISLEEFNIASMVVDAIGNDGNRTIGRGYLWKLTHRIFDPSDRRCAYTKFPAFQSSRKFPGASAIQKLLSPEVLSFVVARYTGSSHAGALLYAAAYMAEGAVMQSEGAFMRSITPKGASFERQEKDIVRLEHDFLADLEMHASLPLAIDHLPAMSGKRKDRQLAAQAEDFMRDRIPPDSRE